MHPNFDSLLLLADTERVPAVLVVVRALAQVQASELPAHVLRLTAAVQVQEVDAPRALSELNEAGEAGETSSDTAGRTLVLPPGRLVMQMQHASLALSEQVRDWRCRQCHNANHRFRFACEHCDAARVPEQSSNRPVSASQLNVSEQRPQPLFELLLDMNEDDESEDDEEPAQKSRRTVAASSPHAGAVSSKSSSSKRRQGRRRKRRDAESEEFEDSEEEEAAAGHEAALAAEVSNTEAAVTELLPQRQSARLRQKQSNLAYLHDEDDEETGVPGMPAGTATDMPVPTGVPPVSLAPPPGTSLPLPPGMPSLPWSSAEATSVSGVAASSVAADAAAAAASVAALSGNAAKKYTEAENEQLRALAERFDGRDWTPLEHEIHELGAAMKRTTGAIKSKVRHFYKQQHSDEAPLPPPAPMTSYYDYDEENDTESMDDEDDGRDTRRRRRHASRGMTMSMMTDELGALSDSEVSHPAHGHMGVVQTLVSKSKRFTEDEKARLSRVFVEERYFPSKETVRQLAHDFERTEKSIQQWFARQRSAQGIRKSTLRHHLIKNGMLDEDESLHEVGLGVTTRRRARRSRREDAARDELDSCGESDEAHDDVSLAESSRSLRSHRRVPHGMAAVDDEEDTSLYVREASTTGDSVSVYTTERASADVAGQETTNSEEAKPNAEKKKKKRRQEDITTADNYVDFATLEQIGILEGDEEEYGGRTRKRNKRPTLNSFYQKARLSNFDKCYTGVPPSANDAEFWQTTGLNNLGQSCFFNALLQLLLGTPVLCQAVLQACDDALPDDCDDRLARRTEQWRAKLKAVLVEILRRRQHSRHYVRDDVAAAGPTPVPGCPDRKDVPAAPSGKPKSRTPAASLERSLARKLEQLMRDTILAMDFDPEEQDDAAVALHMMLDLPSPALDVAAMRVLRTYVYNQRMRGVVEQSDEGVRCWHLRLQGPQKSLEEALQTHLTRKHEVDRRVRTGSSTGLLGSCTMHTQVTGLPGVLIVTLDRGRMHSPAAARAALSGCAAGFGAAGFGGSAGFGGYQGAGAMGMMGVPGGIGMSGMAAAASALSLNTNTSAAKNHQLLTYPTQLRLNDTAYRLNAVVAHKGALDGGHYLSIVLHGDNSDRCTVYDDNFVCLCKTSKALELTFGGTSGAWMAYILTYVREDMPEPRFQIDQPEPKPTVPQRMSAAPQRRARPLVTTKQSGNNDDDSTKRFARLTNPGEGTKIHLTSKRPRASRRRPGRRRRLARPSQLPLPPPTLHEELPQQHAELQQHPLPHQHQQQHHQHEQQQHHQHQQQHHQHEQHQVVPVTPMQPPMQPPQVPLHPPVHPTVHPHHAHHAHQPNVHQQHRAVQSHMHAQQITPMQHHLQHQQHQRQQHQQHQHQQQHQQHMATMQTTMSWPMGMLPPPATLQSQVHHQLHPQQHSAVVPAYVPHIPPRPAKPPQ